MAETKPIPVRLSAEIRQRLDSAANRIGNNRAGVIRFLIDSWLADFEKKGVASLPPDWKSIMAASDNRTKASKQNEESNSAKASPASRAIAGIVRKRNKPAAE